MKIACARYVCLITSAKVNDVIPKSLYTAEEDVNGYESRVAWKLSALSNESREKAEIGAAWAAKASQLGRIYKYFMVYETKKPEYAGAYSHERFMEIVREL